jgi:hypothetical protein
MTLFYLKIDVIEDLYNARNDRTNAWEPLVSKETRDFVRANADRLNSSIIYDRDFNYNYFGFKVNL